jgi:protoporphyrinogen/coproporphyrinogen III oxidase
MTSLRIAVVGGGIAGLAAAHRLLELGANRQIGLELALFEAGPRLGGIIATEQAGGYVIEGGPDAFLTEKRWALDLCERVGLTDRLTGTSARHRRTFVVHAGRLHPLPDGFQLLGPSRLWPVLRSPLFTWRGKARMAMDLVIPPLRANGDESLASFVRRRLGREVLDRVAQPLAAGIYTADPEVLSLMATMPRFLDLERREGSLIRALGRAQRARGGSGAWRAGGSIIRALVPRRGARDDRETGFVEEQARDSSGPRWSLFAAPRDGMETLISSIAAQLPARAVYLSSRVLAIDRLARRAGGPRPFLVYVEGRAPYDADGVIVATQAHHAAQIVAGMDFDLAERLGSISYASSAVITLGYTRDQIAHPLDGFGLVVPHAEGRPILASTFSSVKFPGRAPDGYVLLRVFFGGGLGSDVLTRDDSALTEIAIAEIAVFLGAVGRPHLIRVHRHPSAMPQYLLGHLERVADIEMKTSRHPGLAVAGAAYRGVGVPDCIRSGEEAAEQVLTACAAAVR